MEKSTRKAMISFEIYDDEDLVMRRSSMYTRTKVVHVFDDCMKSDGSVKEIQKPRSNKWELSQEYHALSD